MTKEERKIIKEKHENDFYNKDDISNFIQDKIDEQQEEIDKFEKHMEGECNANT